jgi:hypothetical protein
VRVGLVAAHGDLDFLKQGAQQLFAVLVGGGGCVPDPLEVLTEGEDGGAFGVAEPGRAALFAAGQFGLGVGEDLQCGVPLGFQATRDEPVSGSTAR